MVQGKKNNEQSNGITKNRDQPSNMSFQRKDAGSSRGGSEGKSDGKQQNGNASSFRTDSSISGNRVQGERVLQRWVPDAPADTDGSLESTKLKPTGGAGWDQFAENERRFGLKTDYDENIYTTTIDKSHPQYKQRLAEADKKAREIERSVATNSHVAEERVTDNLAGNGLDEEEKFSGVRRQDFPPLNSSSNRYTPPARRAPTAQSTVSGAPIDPAIISSQLARPDKTASTAKPNKAETIATPATSDSSAPTSESKDVNPSTTGAASSTGKASRPTPDGGPVLATPTVERDVANAFKNFASQQRNQVDRARQSKARNDKEVKLNDLKKFADTFKLNTPVPSDLVSIIAKDPAKQKEIQEKAKRNAEDVKTNPSEPGKPASLAPEVKSAHKPPPSSHGSSTTAVPNRQNPARNSAFPHQGPYNSQSYRPDRSVQGQQASSAQQGRQQPGNLGARLRNMEQNKQAQMPPHPIPPNHEARLPPTGPSNSSDPNFSRRSSGVASAQGARLNPNSSEFRPSPHAATFSPNGNPSTASSPRSTLTAVAPAPVTRSLLKRKPIPKAERPSIADKFNALEYIKSIKPSTEKKWEATGGLKPAYDTLPTWKQAMEDEKPGSKMLITYQELFEMTPFPPQTMSPPHPSHVIPQVPHQHQLPFHLQQGVHNMGPRHSPRQPPMNIHGNQHGQNPAFNNGADDHRMVPSHSAQSFASPRMQNNMPVAAYPSPMNQPAQLAYNPAGMMPYPGAPMPFRSLSSSNQFMPQQGHMGPQIIMQNPGQGFMAAQGMAPGPQMMYPPGGQAQFMGPNGHPPAMPGVNGFPSPGRGAAMMMSQGSQQSHQQQPVYNMNPSMNPGMSPGPQYGAPMYAQQPPGQMRGYGGPNQYGTSPQQVHQFGNQQHRNNHPNGNYNKNFQTHNQHANGPQNNQIPTGPQVRNSEGSDEPK